MQQFCLRKCLAQFVSKNGSLLTQTLTCRKAKYVQETGGSSPVHSCSIHHHLLLYIARTMKTALMQRNGSERLNSETATETDWWINRLIGGRQRGRVKSGQRQEDWINGICTENIGEVGNDSTRDSSAASLSPILQLTTAKCKRMTYLKAGGEHTNTHAHIGALGWRWDTMGRGFFMSDWAALHIPQRTHTPSSGWRCY